MHRIHLGDELLLAATAATVDAFHQLDQHFMNEQIFCSVNSIY